MRTLPLTLAGLLVAGGCGHLRYTTSEGRQIDARSVSAMIGYKESIQILPTPVQGGVQYSILVEDTRAGTITCPSSAYFAVQAYEERDNKVGHPIPYVRGVWTNTQPGAVLELSLKSGAATVTPGSRIVFAGTCQGQSDGLALGDRPRS